MTKLKAIFWNDQELRVRAGWRITIFLLTLAVLMNLLAVIDNLLLGFLPENPLGRSGSILISFNLLIATFLSTWLVAKFIDNRPIQDFGLRLNLEWWHDFAFGFMLGIILMTMIFGVELGLGWISITENEFNDNANYSYEFMLLFTFFTFLCVGIYEEVQSRGYLFKNIAEGFNFNNKKQVRAIVIALIITSLIFGLAHAANPNATMMSSLSIAFAGILLAAGYILRGNLAIPIGLHISWNYVQGNVFGFPVSGTYAGASIININQEGPELWTGGNFGPEAGLLGAFAYIAGILLTILWVKVRYKKIRIVNEIAEYNKPLIAEKDLNDNSVEINTVKQSADNNE